MKCDKCGKVFVVGNRPDGLPNGVAFVAADGNKVTMCADCLIKMGEELEKENGSRG